MKINLGKKIVAGAVVVAAVAMPAMLRADEVSGWMTRTLSIPVDNSISGRISDKTENGITVEGQIIGVNSATAFTRGGARIKLEDLKVGDKVSVVTTKGDDGRLLAVSVMVLPNID